MDLLALVRKNKSKILKIAAHYGANNIRIFGSVARGTAGIQSDIDLLIQLEAGRSLLDHAGFLVDLETLFKRKVDVVTEKGLRPQFRDKILKEAIPL